MERCKLPQWGLGQSPSRQKIWCILESKTAALKAAVLLTFLRINVFHCFTVKLVFVHNDTFILRKVNKTAASRAAVFDSNMHQIFCRLGLCPRPHWGSLQRSIDPIAVKLVFVHKTTFILRKVNKTAASRAAVFDSNMHQIFGRLGLCPRPHWVSLQRSIDPIAVYLGVYF